MTLAVLVLYEFLLAKNLILPPELLKNTQCMLFVGVASVGGMIYYGMSVFWPTMVSEPFQGSLLHQVWLTMTFTSGAALGNIVSRACFRLGKFRWQLLIASALVTTFFGAIASVSQRTKDQGIAFSFLGGFFAGWLEGPTMAAISFTVDQSDVGLAVGLLNSTRVLAGSVAEAIYDAIQSNRQETLEKKYIPRAAIRAGLPSSSVPAVLQAAATKGNLTSIAGVNSTIEAAVNEAMLDAISGGCSLVFKVIIVFGGLAMIGSFFTKNVDEFLTDEVSPDYSR
ncbi:hypothetical protein MAP00_005231 [Monascus purpureus]|nr:hypothetical protein MAP00_005231 [Monascus purpureus]